jgi:hypothetical protein
MLYYIMLLEACLSLSFSLVLTLAILTSERGVS